MDKLVESVIQFLEQLILGAMALGTARYALASFRQGDERTPIEKYVISQSKALESVLYKPTNETNGIQWVRMGIMLALLYAVGVVANSTAYWFMHPAHVCVIAQTQATPPQQAVTLKLTVLPIFRGYSPSDEQAYQKYLCQEVVWRNKNLDALKHALDAHVKSIRLLRGTILFAFLMTLIAALTAGHSWICQALSSSSKSNWIKGALTWGLPPLVAAAGFAGYWQWVGYPLGWKSRCFLVFTLTLFIVILLASWSAHKLRQKFQPPYPPPHARTHVFIALLSISAYLISMQAYRVTEMQFHIMVNAGAQTAESKRPQ